MNQLLLDQKIILKSQSPHSHDVLLNSTRFVQAQANDMFPTQAAAQQHAKELKCSGALPMGMEWMPCKDFPPMKKLSASNREGWPALAGALGLGLLLVAGIWLPATAQAHMRGMFATKAEAEKRAAELKCKGVFAMGSLWMPCANERALHDALQRAQ